MKKVWIAILCLVLAIFAWAKAGEKPRARAAFAEFQNRYSTTAPAKGNLTAWFQARQIPYWQTKEGSTLVWEDIGPDVLKDGWHGADNAGRMCDIVVDPRDPRVIYAAAASGGLWKSVDDAKTWKPIADHQASLSYGALLIDPFNPDVIYAGTGEPHYSLDSYHGAGMLRSRDAGKSWELLGSDIFLGGHFSRIVANPKRPGLIYAATSRGVYRSADAGGTWVKLLDGCATDIVINRQNPNSLIALLAHMSGDSRNGLYASTDAGNSWKKLTADVPSDGLKLGRSQMGQCWSQPQVIYAAMYAVSQSLIGLYRSNDFGKTWTRLPNCPPYCGGAAWYDNYVGVHPTNPNIVFVAGNTTFRSMDGGETWTDCTRSWNIGTVHPDHHAFGFDLRNPPRLYLCTDGGIFRTIDNGDTWEAVNTGLGTLQFVAVDVHPTDKNIAYGGAQDNGTSTRFDSNAWVNIIGGDGGTTLVNWKNPNIVYSEYIGLLIIKSIDGGKSYQWEKTKGLDMEGALFYAPFNLDPNDPDILVAGSRRVSRSTNGAESWEPISPPLGGSVSAVSVAPGNSKVIYAGTTTGKVWVTPNTGKNWYDITKGLPRGYVSYVCIDPRSPRTIYVSLMGWSQQRIWKSTDAGGTWKDVSGDLPGMPIRMIAINPRKPNTVYIATEIGVFVSETGGGNWKRLGRGLPSLPIFTIMVNTTTNYITVATHGRGAWRLPIAD